MFHNRRVSLVSINYGFGDDMTYYWFYSHYIYMYIASGYLTVHHWKSPFLIGKPSISTVHLYHGYVKQPELEKFMWIQPLPPWPWRPQVRSDGKHWLRGHVPWHPLLICDSLRTGNWPIEFVCLPFLKKVIFHSDLFVYQRVSLNCSKSFRYSILW